MQTLVDEGRKGFGRNGVVIQVVLSSESEGLLILTSDLIFACSNAEFTVSVQLLIRKFCLSLLTA